MRYGNSIEFGIWEWESAKRSQKAICHNIQGSQYQISSVSPSIWPATFGGRREGGGSEFTANCGSLGPLLLFSGIACRPFPIRSNIIVVIVPHTRVAAILLEIDANDLNNVSVSQDLVIFKIVKIGNYANYLGNYLGCS